MDEMIITNEDFLKQIKSIERAVDCLETIKNHCIPQLDRGFRLTLFLDSYDILDWFFPPGISFYDYNYSVVHNLWKTVEKYIPSGPRLIRLCISPFSALEMFHLLKVKSEQLTKLKIPSSKKISPDYYSKLIGEVGSLYTAVAEIIECLKSHPNKGHLLAAFEKGHIEALRSFVGLNMLNKNEILKVVGRDLDINPGYKYLISIREKYRKNVSDESLQQGAAFDMGNLGLITYLRDKSEELSMFPIITTSGLFTIFGWERAIRNPEKKSYSHSLLALYLFKGLQKTRDLKEYVEVIDGALGFCKEYLKKLKRNENFVESKNRRPDEKVTLSKVELITQNAWNEMFQQPYFALEKFQTSQERRKPTKDELVTWDDDKRREQQKAIQEKVKLIERQANFIDPELVSILVDKNELVEEILDYARP